ncbi:LUC7-domain-containing protein [Schizosaccharomyces pombe]|uniref:U1 snRNP-associated protein usp106 n=1 Tax=Schizosaccharomyces pombe (strain 972 / ATCC 24843) TaxID=284812 RepID=LUC7_SCHPO|nr:U1 snRNP-associated protein Usp106 [Schizosaccharomyces pombe]Q9USM4.1 RecName: Full=U1 snRNP-associated protein usp106; AltName: Full=Protein luc7 [Schizosaccharomyces pombe 972h-]CAB53085.1 U1 snRNP-associated protein Usp106 [Schizosaccharomyces pombe]|eukprot:NP_588000.1 U1 snRNP-associated protein Usp106 [Schizosaccharomyces pombe]
MAAEQRKIIEQLMGSNLSNFTSRGLVHFTDRKVCRSFLCGICPHDIFTNTKMDLGPCPKIHSDKLKSDYERASYSHDYGYEWDYLEDLERHVDDCNKRIDIAEARREKTKEEEERIDELMRDIIHTDHSIEVIITEMEALAKRKLVNDAVKHFIELNRLKTYRKELYDEVISMNEIPSQASTTHQKLQVCDICSAYLSRLDNDRRLADHFSGKMHLGYAMLRNIARDLRAQLEDREKSRDKKDGEKQRDNLASFEDKISTSFVA